MLDIDPLDAVSKWYWLLASVVTVLHAVRGVWFWWRSCNPPEEVPAESNKLPAPCQTWRRRDRVVTLYIQIAFLYLTTSAAGFYALALGFRYWEVGYVHVSAGHVTFTMFLLVFGFVGAIGEAPPLIHRGKFPWK